MKKTLLCTLLLSGAVLADDSAVDSTSVEETVALEEDASASSVDGFYAGLGVQYTHASNKLKATTGVTVDGDHRNIDEDMSNQSADKFGGTLVAGYGKAFNNLYVGGEALLDVNNNEKIEETYGAGNRSYRAKIKGFVPSAALRLGYACPATNCLIYGKLGVSFVRSEFQELDPIVEQNVRKLNKAAPTLGIGFEKNVRDHFNVRGEVDYRFQVKGTSQTVVPGVGHYDVESRLKGLVARVMVVYKF